MFRRLALAHLLVHLQRASPLAHVTTLPTAQRSPFVVLRPPMRAQLLATARFLSAREARDAVVLQLFAELALATGPHLQLVLLARPNHNKVSLMLHYSTQCMIVLCQSVEGSQPETRRT